jgi:hypothetical protein
MSKVLPLIAAALAASVFLQPRSSEARDASPPSSDVPLGGLHGAAKAGEVQRVLALLKQGQGVNAESDEGWTPLHFACAYGRDDTAALLLDRGANPEARTKFGLTPLHLAAMRGHPSIVTLLLQRGGNPAVVTEQGDTPLHLSADDKVVSALAPNSVAINVLNSFGETPLHTARQSSVARQLLDLGADLRIRTPRGLTAMELASVESLEKSLGISVHSVMLGRLRGLLSQMPLAVTNISPEVIRDLAISAESAPCSIVVSPQPIPPLRPSERFNLALTLTRSKDLPEGDYPIYLTFTIPHRGSGKIDLRVDTRTHETPEDMGMIRLAKGNLRAPGSKLHYLAYIGAPILLFVFALIFRRRSKRNQRE